MSLVMIKVKKEVRVGRPAQFRPKEVLKGC